MKFIIELDLKFNEIISKKEILTIIEDSIITAARNQHIKLLNICKSLEIDKTSLESKKLIEHHSTWIELLEKSKIGCEDL